MIDFSINNVEKLTPRWEINLTLIYMIYTYLSKWNQNNLEVQKKKKGGENVTTYLYSLEKAGTL